MEHILLLGSKSPSRHLLLRESNIPFTVIPQDADETFCDWNVPIAQLVERIALHKMEHAIVPAGKKDGEICFVLTADTLSSDPQGTTNGKPIDRADAIKKIKAGRGGISHLSTAFCIDKKIWKSNRWQPEKRICRVVSADYIFDVPDHWIERYMEYSVGFRASGAVAIEQYGAQFLKIVNGSHSAIIGLPLFELREALDEIGFFS